MRLIDADAFLKYMEEKCDPKSQLDPIIFAIVIGALDEQPTAYDIDKVVEELEIRVNEANNNCLCEMHENGHTLDFENENGRIKGLKEAIEIVKHGGASDDVCEWKKVDEEGYQNCKCNYDETIPDFFKYCPYCSKKIKVVE